MFEARTIKRMELLVLNALKWRMQAVTAFSFIDYYLHKFNDGDGPFVPVVSRSVDLILSTSKGIIFIRHVYPSPINCIECDGDQFLKLGIFGAQLLNSWFSDRQKLP